MDAQNMLPMLNNYLFAADAAASLDETEAPALPCQVTGEWWFPDAGLLIKSTASFYGIVGLAKGGVVKVYDKARRTLAWSDGGYVARLHTGTVASTQSLRRRSAWTRASGTCAVEAEFVPLLQRVPRTGLFLAFRSFSTTLGRTQRVGYWLKNRLVRSLMRPGRAVPLRLRREVELGGDEVT